MKCRIWKANKNIKNYKIESNLKYRHYFKNNKTWTQLEILIIQIGIFINKKYIN